MKTKDDYVNFLKTVDIRQDSQGPIANLEVDRWMELSEYKSTLFLSDAGVTYAGTNCEKEDVDPTWITWSLDWDNFAKAELIFQGESGSTFVSVYLKDEPWWDQYDPFEAGTDQIRSVWRLFPETARQQYKDIVGRVDPTFLKEMLDYLEGPAPAPAL